MNSDDYAEQSRMLAADEWREFSRLPPYWYEQMRGRTPCRCGKEPKVVAREVGYSDNVYFWLRCDTCHWAWVTFLEG